MSSVSTLITAREQFPDKEIFVPDEDEVQIDIDTEEAYLIFSHRLEEIKQLTPVDWVSEIISDSGPPHRHITLRFPGKKLSPLERIALQFVLNSDPIREKLSAYRVLLEQPEPTVFARTPSNPLTEPTVFARTLSNLLEDIA